VDQDDDSKTKSGTGIQRCIMFRNIEFSLDRDQQWERMRTCEESLQERRRALAESQHNRLGKDSDMGKILTPDVLGFVANAHDIVFTGRVDPDEIMGIYNARRNAMLAAHGGEKNTVSQGSRMCMACGLRIRDAAFSACGRGS
jgi:hypothetical protein